VALFKILKGKQENLPAPHKEGWMYITSDFGDIYLDLSDNERIQLNADKANYIRDNSTETEKLLNFTDLYNTIRAIKPENNYWGMLSPDSSDSEWIRTTSTGLLPYAQGGLGAGNSNIGTTNWRFNSLYVDNIYSKELNINDNIKFAYDSAKDKLSISGKNIYFGNELHATKHIYLTGAQPNSSTASTS
jgi:hypothetical protein